MHTNTVCAAGFCRSNSGQTLFDAHQHRLRCGLLPLQRVSSKSGRKIFLGQNFSRPKNFSWPKFLKLFSAENFSRPKNILALPVPSHKCTKNGAFQETMRNRRIICTEPFALRAPAAPTSAKRFSMRTNTVCAAGFCRSNSGQILFDAHQHRLRCGLLPLQLRSNAFRRSPAEKFFSAEIFLGQKIFLGRNF
jgi:hypothetical protein